MIGLPEGHLDTRICPGTPPALGLAMANELTWRQAIEKVLGASASPLHYNDITERIIADGLRKNLGATPSATVNAQLTNSIKKEGSQSPFIRVAKATFAL